jgi:hypothetical protein
LDGLGTATRLDNGLHYFDLANRNTEQKKQRKTNKNKKAT